MTAAIPQHHIPIGNLKMGNDLPFVLIAGPCQMESRDHAFDMCGAISEITGKLGIPLIYKSSFDKANRTSLKGVRGIGLEKGLPVFEEIRAKTGLPVITDIHTAEQCDIVAKSVDVLQIPAFLCRQTDLLIAAAKTGKPINIKKGQFLAPWDMKNVAAKITDSGNPNVMLCERGVTFGYNTLVNDMRALPIMAETGLPVVFDATHSVQQPGGAGNASGGDRRMVPPLARAALAIGCAAIFMETHQDPDKAPSDGPNMVKLGDLEGILEQLLAIDRLIKPEAYSRAQKAA
jgi:2-dehydro-3-deoxyphosphooctonate aldolase (KDO 8-P synthase)